MKKLLLFMLLPFALSAGAQDKPQLSVDSIMRDPHITVGDLVSDVFWSEDSRTLYFYRNPENKPESDLFAADAATKKVRKVSETESENLPGRRGTYDLKRENKVYAKAGDLYLYSLKTKTVRRLTETQSRESDPVFLTDGTIVFQEGNNLFSLNPANGFLKQLTDIAADNKPAGAGKKDERTAFLESEELKLIKVLAERKAETEARKAGRKEDSGPEKIYIGKQSVGNFQISSDGRFISFRLFKSADDKNTDVPNYVTESAYTENLRGRAKVGDNQGVYTTKIYDTQSKKVIDLNLSDLPGIRKAPAFYADYGRPEVLEKDKETIQHGPFWSEDGKNAVVIIRSEDNKDRWICSLEPASGKLKVLDHQHDEAWIGGPGIQGWIFSAGDCGWTDNRTFWFLSEESGFAHLYTTDVETGKKTALTSGKYEVRSVQLSADKKSWYLTTSEVHPGEDHFYKMPVKGGKTEKLTGMTGGNQTFLSPDEKSLAVINSFSNRPEELYLSENKSGAQAVKLTDSQSPSFRAYDWREPEIVTFQAEDGTTVYARLYRPANAEKQGPAVIFVHGAGYLQNADKRWSGYFREYMFHNLLADKGYTVLDIDYRASAGYGRDFRTGIYRHMGGKDLSDQADGTKFLVKNYDIDPARIGIYGGSYGGFITMMALFTQPDVFACGAALRSVTDWAHYNHGYTQNILNTPQTDSLAYVRSSPIYFAEGLKKPLLICHGIIDTNVQFQDVVRLSQRLIELRKENWEMAVYPLEGHGFREPTSWADEYRRILKLFEENIGPGRKK